MSRRQIGDRTAAAASRQGKVAARSRARVSQTPPSASATVTADAAARPGDKWREEDWRNWEQRKIKLQPKYFQTDTRTAPAIPSDGTISQFRGDRQAGSCLHSPLTLC